MHTKDDGLVSSGEIYDTTIQHAPGTSYIVKTDKRGNVLWLKEVRATVNNSYSYVSFYNFFELENGDLIGVASTADGGDKTGLMISRFSKDGNLIWQNSYTSSLIIHGGEIYVQSLTEDTNGEIFVTATTINDSPLTTYETIMRLGSNGDFRWSEDYGNSGDYKFGAAGLTTFPVNGSLIEVGLAEGDAEGEPPAINFLKLNYEDGTLLDKKFYVPDYNSAGLKIDKFPAIYYSAAKKLNNGNYVVYGQIFPEYNRTAPADQFGIYEFASPDSFITAHSITGSFVPVSSNNAFFMNDSGKFVSAMYEYTDFNYTNLYISSLYNGKFLNQRKKTYNSDVAYGSFAFLNDGSYAFHEAYSDEANKSYMEYKFLHDDDASSTCLGDNSLFATLKPIKMKKDAGYFDLQDPLKNKLSLINKNVTVTDTATYIMTEQCRTVSFCDTIKLHGDSIICDPAKTFQFTAYKNAECGGLPLWNIDSSVIDTSYLINDTTISIKFKNIGWNGFLHVAPANTSCSASLIDSLPIHVKALQSNIDLGNDTTLCNSDKLVVHAGKQFKNYLWQDGSTDSNYTVTTAGIYYVTATDFCGNIYSDTIKIQSANYYFSAGNDTSKCNSDSVILKATTGFSNYRWSPAYNTISTLGESIVVFPDTTTSYIVTATTNSNCAVRDTVTITVNTSPSIRLGNDTTICEGETIIFDAGTGFSNYAWNTNNYTQTITANAGESYSVKAITDKGCISKDTIQLTVNALPVFTLGADTTLCNNTPLNYTFNLPGSQYLWNDGSTAPVKTITAPGSYILRVTTNGCSKEDTVNINYKAAPVVNLGNDTVLCNNDTLILNAFNQNATYTWQDNSTLPTFSVTAPGIYFVKINIDGCADSDSINVQYKILPIVKLGSDTSLCNGSTITLQPVVNTNANYYWQDGSNNNFYIAKQPGLYFVKTYNACGATSDSINISSTICQLIMPTAFTPNNDGLNDVFRVKYPYPVKSFSLVIYNRWGQKIFYTDDIYKGWDGTYKSYPLSHDSFVWILRAVNPDGKEIKLQGTITLIR